MIRLSISIGLAAFVVLGGCAPREAPVKVLAIAPLTTEHVAVVHETIRRSLKDPDSARFTEPVAGTILAKDGSASLLVCGFVNAKNSYGGYTGNKAYQGVIMKGEFVLFGIGDANYYRCIKDGLLKL